MNNTIDVQFAVHLCSICSAADLVTGSLELGGVRYCPTCLPNTLFWKERLLEDQINILYRIKMLLDKKDVRESIKKLRKQVGKDDRVRYIAAEKSIRDRRKINK